jgi:DsbC/DsbD-like thiol-disulfide interchange protein
MEITSGEERIDELAEIEFFGSVGTQVTRYAKTSRRFARDLAAELESAAHDSRVAMSALKGHPALLGLDVKIRARRVSRKLKRAKELAQGISAESVKFAAEYRKQFIHAAAAVRKAPRKRRVEL